MSRMAAATRRSSIARTGATTALALLVALVALGSLAGSAWATSVTGFSLGVSPATAGAARVLDTYSFKAKTAIPASTGFVQLRAPSGVSGTFESYVGDYAITVGSTTQYAYNTEVNPEGLGPNVVDVHLPSAVAAGETVTIAAYGVTNPASSGSYEYGVSTSTDTGLVKKAVAIASAGTVTGLSVTATTQAAGARGVQYKASFKATDALTDGTTAAGSAGARGYITVTAPEGAELHSGYVHVVDGSQEQWTYMVPAPEGEEANVGRVEVPSNVAIAAGDTVQLRVPNVRNPSVAKPSGHFSVSTSSDTSTVTVALPIGATTSITGVSASATPAAAGATRALYEVAFTATTALSDAYEEGFGCGYYYSYYDDCGYVRLRAPKGTVFPGNSYDYEVSFGSVSQQPWFVIVDPEEAGENVVDVHLPYGTEVPAGTSAHVKAYGVANPQAPDAAGEIEVSTSLDAKPVSKPLPIGAVTAPSNVSVSANNKGAGASGVHLVATLKATSPMAVDPREEETSYVRLEAPAGSRLGYEYVVSDGTTRSETYGEPNPEGEGENVAWVYVPFAVAAGTTLEVTTNAFSNPPEPSAAAEFGVSTSSDASVVKTAFPVTPPTAVKGVSVSAHPSTAGSSETVDEVAFTTTNALPATTEEEEYWGCYYYYGYYNEGCRHIRLQAPEGTVFSSYYRDYEVAGTSGPAWARNAIVDPEGTGHDNVVNIYLESESGIGAGEKVHLKVFGVKNPSSAGAGDEFAVSTSADPKPVQKSFPIAAATAISALSATESNHTAGAEHVKLSAAFTAAGPLTDGALGEEECCADSGYVRLELPADGSFNGSYNYQVNGVYTYATVNPEGVGANVAWVRIPYEQPVAAGSHVEVVAEGVTNPSTTGSYKLGVSTSSDVTVQNVSYPVGAATLPEDETPPQVGGAAERGGVMAANPGKWRNEPTHYAYQWLRCEGASCTAITGADRSYYELTAADVGKKVEVKVTASNAAGSVSATSAPSAEVAPTAVHAYAGEAVYVTEGGSATLNGSGSSPSEAITSYGWEFGDGSTGSGAVVSHTYAHAGDYTAKLTVSDGRTTSSSTTAVHVAPAPGTEPEVTVDAKGGGHLAGAEVLYIDPRTGQKTAATTDSSGIARLAGLPDGEDTVYAYTTGYRPAAGRLTVSGGTGHTTVQLEAGEVAIATLEYQEMTKSEIEAAGINTSDAANNEVHRFRSQLAFEGQAPVDYTCYLNSAGELVGNCAAPSLPGGETAVPEAFVYEGHPMLEWMVMEGTVSSLKQFVNVHMVIQNLSAEGFTLTHGSATLKLPEGLSLAPTATSQSFTQPVADIAGEHSATVSWVVRGDQPGSYLFSAGYNAQLEPFEAPIAIVAKLKEPLRIWGAEALKLVVEADEGSASTGVPYHVTLAVKNVSTIPLYGVAVAADSGVHSGFIYQPQETYSDAFAEVAPGQTVRSHRYVLVPDETINGLFKPELSSVSFAGEAGGGTEVLAVPAPPSYAIEALGGTAGKVHLHWQAVPGAEGYEVFSTPNLQTPFGETPDQASETAGGTASTNPLTASATDAYLTASGSRRYAVSAIVGGRPTLESDVIAAEPGTSTGLPEFGRCAAATPVNEGKTTTVHGAFTDSKCTKPSAGHEGKYEWLTGPGAKTGISVSYGAVKLETASKLLLSCEAASTKGSLTSGKTLSATTDFTHCKLSSSKAACQSSGAAAEEIRTGVLAGTLGTIKVATKPTVGIDLAPASGTELAQVTCGAQAVSLKGSVIAPISSVDKVASTFKLSYKGKRGVQPVESFAGAPKDTMHWTVGGGSEEAVSMKATGSFKTEEPLEIKAIE